MTTTNEDVFNNFISPKLLDDDTLFVPEVLRSSLSPTDNNHPLAFSDKTTYDWKMLIQRICDDLNPQGQSIYQTSTSILRCTFFSQKNINIIQKYLKYFTYKASNARFRINDQPETVILQYMTETYDNHVREMDEIHMTFAQLKQMITKEVYRLNMLVVDVCVRCIIDSIEGDLQYQNFMNHREVVTDRSKTTSIVGENDVIILK